MNQTPTQEPVPAIILFKRDLEVLVQRELDMLDAKAKQRMKSAAVVAVTKDPELLLADRQSFFAAIRMCAQHGIVPDGVQATLQVYNTKVKRADGKEDWVKKVTYLPMIRGIIERVQRSGKIRLFYADVVYASEEFRIDMTHGDRRPAHTFDPMRRGRDDEIIGAYSVAVYADGTVDCEPMPRGEIEKVRNAARTKNVWDGWYSEKAKVAVMKRHAKRLPLSAEDLEFILNRDESDFDAPRDVTPPEPKASPMASLALAARQSEAQKEAPTEQVDDGHWTDAVDLSDAAPGSTAWDDGVKAAHDGLARTDCPHKGNPAEAADWLAAYDGARRAME